AVDGIRGFHVTGVQTCALPIFVAAAAASPVLCDEAGRPEAESPWEIGIAMGYGKRSNPLIQSDDIDVLVDIDIAWYGERWFFDNGDVGFTVRDGRRTTLNLIGRVNSDRVFFSKTDTEYVSLFGFGAERVESVERVVIPDRDYAFELGVELLCDG